MSKKKEHQFKPGNLMWQQRSKHGRDKIFKHPNAMLESFEEYALWCGENPIQKHEAKVVDKTVEIVDIPTERPLTWIGFCLFCGVGKRYFDDFKKTCTDDFSAVIEQIGQHIENAQLTGASVGIFNANIISRLLGLVDKQEQTQRVIQVEQPDPEDDI